MPGWRACCRRYRGTDAQFLGAPKNPIGVRVALRNHVRQRPNARPTTAGLRTAPPFALVPCLSPHFGTVGLDARRGLLPAGLDADVLLGEGARGPDKGDREGEGEQHSDAGADHRRDPSRCKVEASTTVGGGARVMSLAPRHISRWERSNEIALVLRASACRVVPEPQARSLGPSEFAPAVDVPLDSRIGHPNAKPFDGKVGHQLVHDIERRSRLVHAA